MVILLSAFTKFFFKNINSGENIWGTLAFDLYEYFKPVDQKYVYQVFNLRQV